MKKDLLTKGIEQRIKKYANENGIKMTKSDRKTAVKAVIYGMGDSLKNCISVAVEIREEKQ